MHKVSQNIMNEIRKSNTKCRLMLSNGMGQPAARRRLNMLITEESCKTKRRQDFKGKTH